MKKPNLAIALLFSAAVLAGCAKENIPIADQGTHKPPAGSFAAKAMEHYAAAHGGAPAAGSGKN